MRNRHSVIWWHKMFQLNVSSMFAAVAPAALIGMLTTFAADAHTIIQCCGALEICEEVGEARHLESLIEERLGSIEISKRLVGQKALGREERLSQVLGCGRREPIRGAARNHHATHRPRRGDRPAPAPLGPGCLSCRSRIHFANPKPSTAPGISMSLKTTSTSVS
jgi:hypothetical protein